MGVEDGTAVQEIEITAKQIVDRISVNLGNGGVATGTTPGNSNGQKSDHRQSLSKRLSASYGIEFDPVVGTTDTRRVPAIEESISRSDDSPRPGSGLSSVQDNSVVERSMTEHEKKAEILLNAVTKWLREVNGDLEEVKDLYNVDEILPENFHWIFSIESYIRSLNRSQKGLVSKISTLLVNWHKQLFHFDKPNAGESEYNRVVANWDQVDGIAALLKLNLVSKFPDYTSDGFLAFEKSGKRPVLYCSEEVLGHSLARKLALPKSYVSVVNTQEDTWCYELQQRLEDTTTVAIGIVLNVDAKQLSLASEVLARRGVWLHLYGSNALAYLVERAENTQIGSSFTIDLNLWIRNLRLPILTFYKLPKSFESAAVQVTELSGDNEFNIFSPWLITNIVGTDEMKTAVRDITNRGRFLLGMVRKYDCLQIVPNVCELGPGADVATSITFQYHPSQIPEQASEFTDGAVNEESFLYIETLNSWLYHIMERDLKGFVPVEFVRTAEGLHIRIDVFRSPRYEPEDEEVVLSLFENHLSVLQSTVAQKKVFRRLVLEAEELQWVNHESVWAGIGAVRYIPSFQRIKPEGVDTPEVAALQLEESSKENVDHLNAQIVDKLKAIDSAFSLGEGSNGEWCVQFGMVTMETDVKELVRLVISAGQEIEEGSEFLNKMSELVKQGIEKATEELRREAEDALWEEGILRRVPVVGTFVNWFSPQVKETGVRGRALNLTQGKVQSTENIYKYHMQVVEETPNGNQQ